MGTAASGGKVFKGRAGVSGKRPIGTARCRQQNIQASCQTTTPCLPGRLYAMPSTLPPFTKPLGIPDPATSLFLSHCRSQML